MNNTTRNLLNLTPGLTTAWSISAAGIEEKTANEATPAALPSQTLPLLNSQIDHATDFVNLVNTNSAPCVFTRVYKLKHADPCGSDQVHGWHRHGDRLGGGVPLHQKCQQRHDD